MPKIQIEGFDSCEAEKGERLVLSIEGCGVDIGHRCGGYARCTTCRVEFLEGEPETMTAAEHERLEERGLLGEVRLSCQIVVDRDMHVKPLMLVSEQGWSDPGPEPEETVTPESIWYPKRHFEA